MTLLKGYRSRERDGFEELLHDTGACAPPGAGSAWTTGTATHLAGARADTDRLLKDDAVPVGLLGHSVLRGE